MIGTTYPKYIESLNSKTPLDDTIKNKTKCINYNIIKTDSLGNTQILSSGSYDSMKDEYMNHNYTIIDGYYIVEVDSVIRRVVK